MKDLKTLEKNYIEFDYDLIKITEYNISLGIYENIDNIKKLYKVFGKPEKNKKIEFWQFKIFYPEFGDKKIHKFIIYKKIYSKKLEIATNTDNKAKINYFFDFLSEIKKTLKSARNSHKNIPDYKNGDYQLKRKIAVYTIPPIKPPNKGVIYKIQKNQPYRNKYGELIFEDYPNFKPNLTPKEVLHLGSFGGTYFRSLISGITGKYYENVWREFPREWFHGLDIKKQITSQKIDPLVNKYKVRMGGNLDMWESSGWISELDPYGWFQWYCRFYLGRRTSEDERQIKRWQNACGKTGRFKITLIRKIINMKKKYNDYTVGASGRQGMQHWAYQITKRDFNEYIKNK